MQPNGDYGSDYETDGNSDDATAAVGAAVVVATDASSPTFRTRYGRISKRRFSPSQSNTFISESPSESSSGEDSSPGYEFDKVLGRRRGERPVDWDGVDQWEYLVKYSGVSYIHVAWVAREVIAAHSRWALQKVKKFDDVVETTGKADAAKVQIGEIHTQVDRVLHAVTRWIYVEASKTTMLTGWTIAEMGAHSRPLAYAGTAEGVAPPQLVREAIYLVRWSGMSSMESTWERKKDVGDDAEIEAYYQRSELPKAAFASEPVLRPPPPAAQPAVESGTGQPSKHFRASDLMSPCFAKKTIQLCHRSSFIDDDEGVGGFECSTNWLIGDTEAAATFPGARRAAQLGGVNLRCAVIATMRITGTTQAQVKNDANVTQSTLSHWLRRVTNRLAPLTQSRVVSWLRKIVTRLVNEDIEAAIDDMLFFVEGRAAYCTLNGLQCAAYAGSALQRREGVFLQRTVLQRAPALRDDAQSERGSYGLHLAMDDHVGLHQIEGGMPAHAIGCVELPRSCVLHALWPHFRGSRQAVPSNQSTGPSLTPTNYIAFVSSLAGTASRRVTSSPGSQTAHFPSRLSATQRRASISVWL